MAGLVLHCILYSLPNVCLAQGHIEHRQQGTRQPATSRSTALCRILGVTTKQHQGNPGCGYMQTNMQGAQLDCPWDYKQLGRLRILLHL